MNKKTVNTVTVTMTYPARCKHCYFCNTFNRKTYCHQQPEAKRITQRDKACANFKL